jgi:hypothetical protein
VDLGDLVHSADERFDVAAGVGVDPGVALVVGVKVVVQGVALADEVGNREEQDECGEGLAWDGRGEADDLGDGVAGQEGHAVEETQDAPGGLVGKDGIGEGEKDRVEGEEAGEGD